MSRHTYESFSKIYLVHFQFQPTAEFLKGIRKKIQVYEMKLRDAVHFKASKSVECYHWLLMHLEDLLLWCKWFQGELFRFFASHVTSFQVFDGSINRVIPIFPKKAISISRELVFGLILLVFQLTINGFEPTTGLC